VETGNVMDWEAVIGLEVHAQLKTRTKLFCACPTDFGAAPNTQVCPVCLGHPGVLPVVNARAVEFAVRTGIACGARVHPVSVFARKNYFYPDLPKNYQITQYEHPLCEGGTIPVQVNGSARPIALRRIHLEEDAGKSMHPERAGETRSRIDLNRCGVPLIEIVSEPEIRTPQEAHAFLVRLRQLVVWLDVCDGNMEEGSLRCDANVSVRPRGTGAFGTRTELKNLNSFRFIERSLAYEIARQRGVLESGGEVDAETLLWDPAENRTRTMRGKEEEHDYRYFPEPDLPPLVLTEDWIEQVRAGLPELPGARSARFVRDHGLPESEADLLCGTRELADYFEELLGAQIDARLAANWVLSELSGRLNARGIPVAASPVGPAALGALVREVVDGRLSGRQAKQVLDEAFETGRRPSEIARERGLAQVSDESTLDRWVREVLESNPKQVAEYLAGREGVLRFFAGQVMRISGGQANPSLLHERLRQELGRRRKP